MNRRPVSSLFITLLIATALAFAISGTVSAQDVQSSVQVQSKNDAPPTMEVQAGNAGQPNYAGARVARLSFTEGDVQYQTRDEDWQTAPLNLPIQQGFRLATTDGRAEVQFESGLILRLAENSILEFTQLDTLNSGRITKLNLTQGTIIVTADLRPVDSFSVDAPNVHVTVRQPARFRIDTTQGDSWVGIFAGDLLVKTETGETKVTSGHTFHISAADVSQVSIDLNPAQDDFDLWAADRDRAINQGYRDEVQYVANDAPDYSDYSYGMADLSSYGHWIVVAGSGLCWEPYGVPDHWRPFFFGSWEFFNGLGWTWLSSEPWGWLPFHTGHWFPRAGGQGWVWQPGSFRAWNPAPVNWLNVGNQLAWAPAGTLNSHGQPPASGIVVGTREERGIRITPGVRLPLSSELTEKITRTTAPVVQRSDVQRSEFHAGAAPIAVSTARPKNFPGDNTIRFDPATRTYMNAHPARQPNPPDAADNSAAASSPGGGLAPHRAVPVPIHPSNMTPRPAYIVPPAPSQQHSAPPHYYTPPAQPHSSPPPPAHSSPPPAHTSSGGAGHH